MLFVWISDSLKLSPSPLPGRGCPVDFLERTLTSLSTQVEVVLGPGK